MKIYKRSPKTLKEHATLFWPSDLATKEQATSVIPKLIATQDKFISILVVSDSTPEAWKTVLSATNDFPANLFLKHLMILADLGGEPLQRIKAGFDNLFPEGVMRYIWKGRNYEYLFQAIPKAKSVTNRALHVDGQHFHRNYGIEPLMEDIIMLLLHGAASLNQSIPDIIRDRCILGTLLGEKIELDKFVKQRYIWVSRITGGATSNTMGQIAQDYVYDILKEKLPKWKIHRNGTIPGISHHAGETNISFDIVAKSPKNIWFGIEVSFQFTTNSVIERKAGQAESRLNLLHNAGHKIVYIIDGAGNFARDSALSTICKYSDCTVAFTPSEFELLVHFLRRNSAKD